MQISFDTAHTSTDELTALIALCASLGGRLPNITAIPIRGSSISDLVASGELSDAHAAGTDEENAAGLVAYQAGMTTPTDDVPPPPAAESTEGKAGQTDTPDVATTEVSTDGTTTGTASAATELDADGIPWDERIHASTKTKTQAGVWTKKRKVDEVLYGQIHAELQELHAGNDDTPPPPASSTPDENAPTDDTDVPPPPAPDALDGSDVPVFGKFADLVDGVALFNLPYVKLVELAVKVTDGLVTKFPDLRDKPDYWADFYELVKNEAG